LPKLIWLNALNNSPRSCSRSPSRPGIRKPARWQTRLWPVR
jgi:hypothetical protein